MIARALEATRIDREASAITLVGLVILLAIGFGRPQWLLGALPVWGYTVAILFRVRSDRIGLPTLVTLTRGLLLAMMAGFVFWRGPILLVALAYTVAVVLDDVDGRLARKLRQTTPFGARLDMELDAAGILIASTLGILYGKLPTWYLAIGLARYLFVFTQAASRRSGGTSRELDPSRLRRLFAGLSMGFLAVALWPFVPAALTMKVAFVIGGASLMMFARDFQFTLSTTRSTTR